MHTQAVRPMICGILCDDSAGFMSRSQGLVMMMAVVADLCDAFGLTVSKKRANITCLGIPGIDTVKVDIKAG